MKETAIPVSVHERAILAVQAQDALNMHLVWMERGYAFLKGKAHGLPDGFVRSVQVCPVGTWLQERLDPVFRGLPLFERTNRLHEEFHVVLDQLFAQDIANVPAHNRQRFHQVGDDLTRALEEWIALGKSANA
ncbi:MAG: CZB domain-containing protein [Candidatus Baltobacteraceae bacterium]